jgi:hypothetical protein
MKQDSESYCFFEVRVDHSGEVAGGSDRVGEDTPNIFPNGQTEVEIRKLMDVEDFGDAFTPNPEIAKVKLK